VQSFYRLLLFVVVIASQADCRAQFTHQDTLRGSVGPGRDWWNVTRYNLEVTVDIPNRSISGKNEIVFTTLKTQPNRRMQIDLQEPMEITRVENGTDKKPLSYKREGNVYWVDPGVSSVSSIIVYYKGKPRVAVNAPWDGGWIWTKDQKGNDWVTVACQGLGASVWYPCKDYQGDEPDNGASLSITVASSLTAVGNGRLKNKTVNTDGTATWQWEVKSPINNYTIIPYIGKYVNWEEKYAGEKGALDCSYWVLDYNLAKAKKQFAQVKPMMQCFEKWFGPYPFYDDSYKLVETPHLGMEHQSAVAYGNKFVNGYLGMDRSMSGWGKDWDYIIIHESGHEWFANNITTNDIADMWVHEGFTTYSEVLYVECQHDKAAGDAYCQGLRMNIQNDKPIIGLYGVNEEGSGDMYDKGANMIHTIRQVIDNDDTFRKILRGLNKQFYHQTITTQAVERYMSEQSGKDLSKIFDQYLRTIKIPVLEYKITGSAVSFRWSNCVPGFAMPVKVSLGKKDQWITPTEKWESLQLADWYDQKTFAPDKNFYITVKKVL